MGCTYDAWNRLVQANSGAATLASFAYDGLGRRIQKSSSGTTDYYLAGQQVVETDCTTGGTGGTPSLQYQYVWSPRYIDAPVLRDDFTLSGAENPHLYYLNDANFNVTALTAANGSIVERYVYDAYGEVSYASSDWSTFSTSSTVGNTAFYAGRELDPETGLYYYLAAVLQFGPGEVYRQRSDCLRCR